MKDIVNEAISFNTYYEDLPAEKIKSKGPLVIKDKTPYFTNFYFDSIYCNGAKTAIAITGLPEMPVDKIHFKNMVISADKGFEATDASEINLDNVKIIASEKPLFLFNNVKNINIKGSGLNGDPKSYYKADANTSGVTIEI